MSPNLQLVNLVNTQQHFLLAGNCNKMVVLWATLTDDAQLTGGW